MLPRLYSTREAKTKFSKLLREAEKGKEVVIARRGMPVAKLIPIPPAAEKRAPGRCKEMIKIHPSFYDPVTEEEAEEARDWGVSNLESLCVNPQHLRHPREMLLLVLSFADRAKKLNRPAAEKR